MGRVAGGSDDSVSLPSWKLAWLARRGWSDKARHLTPSPAPWTPYLHCTLELCLAFVRSAVPVCLPAEGIPVLAQLLTSAAKSAQFVPGSCTRCQRWRQLLKRSCTGCTSGCV